MIPVPLGPELPHDQPTWTTIPGEWETRRMPDAVRAAALANAVDLCRQDNDVTTQEVLDLARTFEAYLMGDAENRP